MTEQFERNLDRFWNRVAIGSWDDCWPWGGSRIDGYGSFWIDGRNKRAHRVAFEFLYGPIPYDLCVCHHCDHPPCVNPVHLFLGSQADNQADKVAKQRQARGEAHGNAKLLSGDIARLRFEFACGASKKSLARRFGITRVHVRSVVLGHQWRSP